MTTERCGQLTVQVLADHKPSVCCRLHWHTLSRTVRSHVHCCISHLQGTRRWRSRYERHDTADVVVLSCVWVRLIDILHSGISCCSVQNFLTSHYTWGHRGQWVLKWLYGTSNFRGIMAQRLQLNTAYDLYLCKQWQWLPFRQVQLYPTWMRPVDLWPCEH